MFNSTDLNLYELGKGLVFMALDYNSLTLLDIIDVNTLQKIQDAFAKATGMAALATDKTGSVTHLSNPTQFCMTLTRPNPIGCERCNQCDLKGGEESARTGKPAVYYCHAGLMDFAAPVIVNGQHIGSLIGGQVLPEKPDEAKFRRIAREIGIDEDEYWQAIKKIKVMPKEQIESAANLLFEVANSLSEVGFQKLIAVESKKNLEYAIEALVTESGRISHVMENVNNRISSMQETFASLLDEVNDSAKNVKKSNKIVTYIKDISMQLTLLGFNASVEARKAGSYGAGFNSIAQEMRRLSDETSTQTKMIDKMLAAIRNDNANSKTSFESATEYLNECSAAVNELAEVVSKISELSDNLKSL